MIAIGHHPLLGQWFEKVFIASAVFEELTDSKTPEDVRHLVLSLPAWLEVRPVGEAPLQPFPVMLHRGEREAIVLAEILRADILLIDEQIGRNIALNPSAHLVNILVPKRNTLLLFSETEN